MRKLTILIIGSLFFSNFANAQKIFDLKTEQAGLEIVGRTESEKMGRALAVGDLNGDEYDDIIMGAPFDVADSSIARVYVLFGKDDLPLKIDLTSTAPDLEIIAEQKSDGLGTAILLADVNADGTNDLLIGAPFSDVGAKENAGRVYVIFGKPSLPDIIDLNQTPADISILGENLGDNLGHSLATGDVVGNNLQDIIVGAQGATTSNGDATGKVYVFLLLEGARGDVEASTLASIQVLGKNNNDRIGYAVSSGDLNNDSIDDLIIGSFKRDVSASRVDAGETYIIFGFSTSQSVVIDLNMQGPDVVISGGKKRDHFGIALSTGDVNDDDIDDLIVGARQGENGILTNAGHALIFFGKSNWPQKIDLQTDPADLKIIGEEISANLGTALQSADLSGDGIDDIIVGAPFGGTAERFGSGKSYLIMGGANLVGEIDLLSQPADITVFGADSLDMAGVALGVGDINNDGMNDLIIGAENAETSGKCYLLLGGNQITSVSNGPEEAIPAEFALHQNYPNPFNGGTAISFSTKTRDEITLKIFDLLGREIKTLFSGIMEPGIHALRWNAENNQGQNVSSGLYFAVLQTAEFRQTRKLVLLK